MILEATIALTFLGILFAVGLAIASKVFEVKVDPKITEVRNVLPSANCGACGFAGCDAFAEAVVLGKAPVDGCVPGQKSVADKICAIMAKDAGPEKEKLAAQLKCAGDCEKAGTKFDYTGIKNCNAAALINNGPKQCVYGCMGFGDCVRICPVGAITLNKNKLPVVDKEKCIACGKCVKECPKKLYVLAPFKKKVHVLCSSKDPGKIVIKACKVGCIACKKCEQACKFDAVHVSENLSVISYEKCVMCGACVRACPRNIIIDERKAKSQDDQKRINEELRSKTAAPASNR